MTSLRAFQTEIDDIHAREIAKQRAQGAATKEKEAVKHKSGTHVDTKGPVPVKPGKLDAKSPTVTAPAGDAKKPADAPATGETESSPTIATDVQRADDAIDEAQETEIQVRRLTLRPPNLSLNPSTPA